MTWKDSGRVLLPLHPSLQIRWMKAHLTQAAVDHVRITAADFYGNGQADILANQGTEEHGPLAADATWNSWADFANNVFHIWSNNLEAGGPLLARAVRQ
eukprot:4452440-Amphidinium_carterae.2